MRRWSALGLAVCATLAAQQAPIPTATETPSHPFSIRNTWVIGGAGNWGYLTLDPSARQLFVTHGTTVQVVDIDSGSVAGTVGGFAEARQVVLDPNGQTAYVADGPASEVKFFDRRSLRIVAALPTGPFPRSLAFDPSSGLLLVVCSGQGVSQNNARSPGVPPNPARPRPNPGQRRLPPQASGPLSMVTLIDTAKRAVLANVVLSGRLGYAYADGSGAVYLTVNDRSWIARLNPGSMRSRALQELGGPTKSQSPQAAVASLDWTGTQAHPDYIPIGADCQDPRGIAVDAHNNRMFVACGNQTMSVVDLDKRTPLTSLTIGPGADAIAFDPEHDLIFTANGGGYGSVTVIRQHLTDSYAVVQNLPTMQQAHTLAVDPSSGQVYLVTTLYGVPLGNPPKNGIGTLKLDPVDGSFQVLVLGP